MLPASRCRPGTSHRILVVLNMTTMLIRTTTVSEHLFHWVISTLSRSAGKSSLWLVTAVTMVKWRCSMMRNVGSDYVSWCRARTHGGYIGALWLEKQSPMSGRLWVLAAASWALTITLGYCIGVGSAFKQVEWCSIIQLFTIFAEDDFGENNSVGASCILTLRI